LNEEEREWLGANGIESDPLGWLEWKNPFPHSSDAARELLKN
jgi:hypothetical protein